MLTLDIRLTPVVSSQADFLCIYLDVEILVQCAFQLV